MANASIPSLPVAITLDGTEQLEIVQPPGSGGTTKRATAAQIANTGTSFVSTSFQITTPTAGGLAGGAAFTSNITLVFNPAGLNGKTTASLSDGVAINNNASGTPALVSIQNFLKFIPSLTNLAIPNLTSDVLGIVRSADGIVYKITPSALGIAAGNVPAGGTTNQFLAKNSNTNYDTVWTDPAVQLRAFSLAANPTNTATLSTSTLVGNNFTFSTTALLLTGFTGDVFGTTNSQTLTINTAAVSYAKFQQLPGLSVHANTSSATAISTAVAGTANQVLRIDPSGTALAFGQLNLSATAAITGTLNVTAFLSGIVTVPLGGTGTTALTAFGIVYGNGTSAAGVTSAGSAGQAFLGQTTTSAPQFVTIVGDIALTAAGTATIANGVVTYAKIQQVAALSVVGNSSSATATAVAVSGTANQVLVVNPGGTAVGFGQVNLSSTSAVTGSLNVTAFLSGIVTVPLGGTGTSALTANGIIVGNGTSAVGFITAGTAGQLLIGQTSTSNPSFVTSTGDITYSAVGTATIATNAVTYVKFQQMTALSVHANTSSAVANSTAVAGTAGQVLLINTGGTGLLFGQVNLAATTSGVTGILPVANGGTNASVAATAIVNLGGLSLTTTGQAFTGGVGLTSLSLGTAAGATTTLVAGNPPLQRIIINGTASFVAPSGECEIDLLVTNAGSASTITLSGYSVGSATGDTYTTTSGYKFFFISRTCNGSSTYSWKALQA